MAPNSNPLLLHLVCSAVARLIPSLSRFRHASNHPQFGDDAQTHCKSLLSTVVLDARRFASRHYNERVC